MKATEFRVRNYRNIEDSGPIPLERVTNFVGRNESGKTTLLKALHKFNPATEEPYVPRKEFPRDRYTRDYVARGSKGSEWPVCTVTFESSDRLTTALSSIMPPEQTAPSTITVTRFYDGSLSYEYEPPVTEIVVLPNAAIEAVGTFAGVARRIAAPDPEQEEATTALREKAISWATKWVDYLKGQTNLRSKEGSDALTKLHTGAQSLSGPLTADAIEALNAAIEPILAQAKQESLLSRVGVLVEPHLPVFIYFENYGILDSAVWLPRFLEDYARDKTDPKARTISAMFQHVGLDAKEITELGNSASEIARRSGQPITEEMIANDAAQKEERSIRLNSASIDISNRFSAWWSQRRHKIRYHADGDYFRIWIADDRRPDVEIELEARSKGFQWFFSFYLLFLVESDDGHKDAILLLDEPGMHLHPTAQQELIAFFETLAAKNQLLYSTHSPFLVDGEHLHRVRPVTEDDSGHSRISVETWPKDRETIFPLQAAAGYAMARGLFRHARNVLVEGMSDYYYLHALSHQCRATGRAALPADIYITACGGTKLVGILASLFLGQEVRPLVLLDGDDAARVRRTALLKELYIDRADAIVMLDEVLGRSGDEVEVEDIIGEALILPVVNKMVATPIQPNDADRKAGGVASVIKTAAQRQGVELPDGWKASVAIKLVSEWAEKNVILGDDILNQAESLFKIIGERFGTSALAV